MYNYLTPNFLYNTIPHGLCRCEAKDGHSLQSFVSTHSEKKWQFTFHSLFAITNAFNIYIFEREFSHFFRGVGLGVSNLIFFFVFFFAQLDHCRSPYWWEFCVCSCLVTFQVITFHLWVWLILDLFPYLAFSHLGHDCQDMYRPWDRNCVHRLDLSLCCHPEELVIDASSRDQVSDSPAGIVTHPTPPCWPCG